MSILPQLLTNSLITASVLALFAIGFNLTLGTVKFFNVAYGAAMLAGGYGFFLFYKVLDWPFALAILLGLLCGGAFSYLSYKLVFEPLRNKGAKNFTLLIASFGVLIICQALVAIFFTPSYQPLLKDLAVSTYQIGSVRINLVQIVSMLATIIVAALTIAALKWSRFGKAVRAIRDDEEVARLSGINTKKIISTLFFLSGIFAAMGTIFWGLDTGIGPSTGMTFIVSIVAASIIGGIGSVGGGVLGALLIGLAENIGIWMFSGEWRDVIVFSVFILFLIFLPRGLISDKI